MDLRVVDLSVAIQWPWHSLPTSEGRPAGTIDRLELEHFFAPDVVLDLRGHAAGDIVCLRLGHDERFATERHRDDYPGLRAAATGSEG